MASELSERPGVEPRVKDVDCPFCASASSILVSRHAVDRLHGVPGEYHYSKCLQCKSLYQNPRVIDEDIALLYPADYAPWDSSQPFSRKAMAVWKQWLRDRLTITGLPSEVRKILDGGGQLLDVGCGSGKFLERILSEHPAARPEGLDFSVEAVESVRSRLNIPVHHGQLDDLADQVDAADEMVSKGFDVITMWWYLEHVPDPRAVLNSAKKLLNPGGILAIGVPSADAFNRVVFRNRWFHLDPPRHLAIPSHKAISNFVEKAGFELLFIREDLSPWGILGSLDYLIHGSIHDVKSSLVANRMADLLFRPISVGLALIGRADCMAIYALNRE